jgi:hypothetical protein
MAQERAGAATVIAQEGESVQLDYNGKSLTVPMRGFPPGFKLAPGRRVILIDEPTGPVARPLVRAITSTQLREALGRQSVIATDDPTGPVGRAITPTQLREAWGKRSVLEHEGRLLELQEATVFDEPQPGDADRAAGDEEPGSEDYELWIVERAEGDPTDQVIAVRRR